MKKDIIVSHPGTQHSYWIASAIQETGRLNKYITSFYYKNKRFPYDLVKYFPRLDNLLSRRLFEPLNQNSIFNIPYYELIERVYRKLSMNYDNNIVYWRDRAFDRHVAVFHIKKDHKILIGHLNACYNSFKKIKKLRGICVLDSVIGYYEEAQKILSKEKLLNPEFADSLGYIDFPESYKNRIDSEIELADHIIVGSNFSKNSLLNFGYNKKNIHIINNCSWFKTKNNNKIRKSSGLDTLKVVYFGQLSQRKGIKYLLEAIKNLKNQDLDVELTMIGKIIGSGSGLKNYNQYFRYVPFVRKDILFKRLIKQDVFVFPSLFEGFGTVISDALSCGLPVITTENTGCEAIENSKSGFIIPIRSTKAIEEKLKLLYNDRDLLYDMKINALERSKEFTFERYKDNIKRLFKDIR